MNRSCPATIPAILWLSVLAAPCHAAPKAPPETVQTVTYNVAEFLQTARPDDQPNPKILPIDPNAPIGYDTQLPSQTESRQQFIKFICETVDPRSWKEADHVPPAAIAIDGDKMVVTQTKVNQRGIANILKQLHDDGSQKLKTPFDQFRLADTKFDKITIFEAIQSIAKETKTPIQVDWRSFGNVLIFVDTQVTVDLKRPTALRAIRATFASAAGYTFPIWIGATPKAITVSYDNADPKELLTRFFDVHPFPARVCGLDPGKPYTRAQALVALVDRIKKEVPDIKEIRDLNGWLIIKATSPIQLQVVELLDELDAKAITEGAPAGKHAGEKAP
jgi:hypothetical protein